MKIIVIILTLSMAYIKEIRNYMTLILTAIWALYTIYQIIKLLKIKDKKIVSKKVLNHLPNDNYPSHIRYLYKRKVDAKTFVCTIFELIIKDSISLKRNNGEYYFIDNKIDDEELTSNQSSVKNILFMDIGNGDNVSLSTIKRSCNKNAGYIANIIKEWKITCEYECIKDKYFKSIKNILEDYLFYFVISFIIAFYNVVFTKHIIVAIVIFITTSLLSVITNNLKKISEESITEYKEWIEFKNYIDKSNELSLLDNNTLEIYSLYAYVLDSYKSFKEVLMKKYLQDNKVFENSVILSIMNASIFDDIEKIICNGISSASIRSCIYIKNKGRRV